MTVINPHICTIKQLVEGGTVNNYQTPNNDSLTVIIFLSKIVIVSCYVVKVINHYIITVFKKLYVYLFNVKHETFHSHNNGTDTIYYFVTKTQLNSHLYMYG